MSSRLCPATIASTRRVLLGDMKCAPETVMVDRQVYDEAIKQTLIVLWEAADRICGKRLKAGIPNILDAMERHGHLRLDAVVRKNVLKVSAATIDRMLKPVRATAGHRRKRKPIKRVSQDIPIKTSHSHPTA